MKFGIAVETIRRAQEAGDLAAQIERLGFDSLWTPDHVSFSQPILDPFATLAIYASRTQRLQLGTAVLLLPLRHPTHVAKLAASLDWASGGRLVLGLGVGGEFPAEFAACEVPLAARGRRASAAIEVMRALWRNEAPPANEFFHVPRTALAPASPHAGGPPLWIGGRSEAALRRTAELADGYLGYFLDAAGLRTRAARLAELRAEARDADRRAHPLTMAVHAFMRVGASREAALASADARLGLLYGQGGAGAAKRFAISGTIDDCRAAIGALAEAGAEHLVLSPIAGDADLDEQLAAAAEVCSLRSA